ncbi:MAG: LLM class flavin-dependent oxidoreductase, partial [Verrucomicrobia bacterium]|nr:LLM class flavin-dependent oxidoreductase [Verrucomicrobiota bacterium]
MIQNTSIKADVLRGPFDPGGQPALKRKDHIHLSLFAWNVRSGLSASKAVLADPDRYRDFWRWPSAAKLLKETEAAGFDSEIQYGMWSGYGGATGWNDASLDFATGAAAAAATTEKLGLFTTIHVGYEFHPLLIAKITGATDYISGGRLAVNLVAAQNIGDFHQFGFDEVPSSEVRYDIADEFTTLLKYLWSSDEPIDFDGQYFQAHGAQINPRPAADPRPLLMNAAGSDRGLEYACKQCDCLFVTANDSSIDAYAGRAKKLHDMAAGFDRQVRVCAMVYVVMDETDAKAAATVDWIREEIDRDAIENWL